MIRTLETCQHIKATGQRPYQSKGQCAGLERQDGGIRAACERCRLYYINAEREEA